MTKILAIDTCNESCSVAIWQSHEQGDNQCNDQLTGAYVGSVVEQITRQPRMHAQLVLPMVSQVLAESGLSLTELDCIAFGAGPGSFTGLRIAASVTQGLAFGADLPVVPVSTLAAMAKAHCAPIQEAQQQVAEPAAQPLILAAFDARLSEVYYGFYSYDDNGFLQTVQADQLAKPESIVLPDNIALPTLDKAASSIDASNPTVNSASVIGLGSAWSAYPEELKSALSAKNIEVYMSDATAEPTATAVAELASVIFANNGGQDVSAAQPVYLRNDVTHRK